MEGISEEEKAKLYLERLESLWNDSRKEVLQRITQRDTYFIRMSILIGATFVGTIKHAGILFVAPIIALYYSILIFHSYQIHKALASYMRDELEVKIQGLLGQDYLEYEQMFKSKNLVGVRSWMYEKLTLAISCIVGLAALFVDAKNVEIALILSSCALCSWYWHQFGKNIPSDLG